MRYKNTKTGAIIDSPCVIKGGDWIEVVQEVVQEVQEEVKRPVKATAKTKARE